MQPLPRDRSEALALQALVWLSSQDALLPVFLGWSGMAPDELRARLRDPDLLPAILDFVLLEDDSVLALAEHLDLPPDMILRARAGLPGGDLPNWT